MRDNADLMDDILNQQQREYDRETAVSEMVEEMWEDAVTIIYRRRDKKVLFFGVDIVINHGSSRETCVGAYSGDDMGEAIYTAEREAEVYFEKVAREKLGVR